MKHPLLQFFTYAHLRPDLAEASKPLCEVAEKLAEMSAKELREDGVALLAGLREKSREALPRNSESIEADEKLYFAQDGARAGYHLVDVLRYVLEAKDCAVRAVVFKSDGVAE